MQSIETKAAVHCSFCLNSVSVFKWKLEQWRSSDESFYQSINNILVCLFILVDKKLSRCKAISPVA